MFKFLLCFRHDSDPSFKRNTIRNFVWKINRYVETGAREGMFPGIGVLWIYSFYPVEVFILLYADWIEPGLDDHLGKIRRVGQVILIDRIAQ